MESVRIFFSKFLFPLSRSPIKEACAEFLGTFILVACGDAVMATIVLGRLGDSAPIISAFGWGWAIVIAISISGGISGGHVNPAVTVAFAAMKKCSWKLVIPYLISQYLASFIAAALVYAVYYDAINHFDQGLRQLPPNANSTAQIFSTYPQDFASSGTCFLDQVIGTAIFVIVICGATDQRYTKLSWNVQPITIGLGLTTVGLAFGYNCGAPLNPARDFSPRLFTAIAGWGLKTINFRNFTWFWIPVVAPHLGAFLGVLLYEFFIAMPFQNYDLISENGLESEDSIGIPAASTFSPFKPPVSPEIVIEDVKQSSIDSSTFEKRGSLGTLPQTSTSEAK